jgi:hypothetical protein
MVFTRTAFLSGTSGRDSIFWTTPIAFSEIFDTTPQYYPGSLVCIQEVVQINCSYDPNSGVDADLGWFVRKDYLGTWQISNGSVAAFDWIDGDYGYINGIQQKIVYHTYWSIVADINNPIARGEQFQASPCNFFLEPSTLLQPDVPPIPGFTMRDLGDAEIVGVMSLSPAPLLQTNYTPKVNEIGLWFRPGVTGYSVIQEVRAVRVITSNYPQMPIPVCSGIDVPCIDQFGAFLSVNGFYATEADCSINGDCLQGVWTCPSDQSYTQSYWEVVQT